jgi:hypothetical protein
MDANFPLRISPVIFLPAEMEWDRELRGTDAALLDQLRCKVKQKMQP